MLDSQVLDEALTKKNKELEKTTRQMEEMKKTYENKIKNLMNSINSLKNQNQDLENTTKDNIRVSIINKLKEERKDQEQVIDLLRKLINDEEKVDKYLLKEFDKKGNQRNSTYEELKIKIKQLEAEIVSQKYKQMTNTKNKTNSSVIQETEDLAQIKAKATQKYQEEILKCEDRIQFLEEENKILSQAKEKMGQMQTELFEKLKNYNKEIGEMKSIYDVIKKNLEDESNMKINDLMNKLKKTETENVKLKEKIKEMIELSENSTKENVERIKKVNSDNEILKRLLESKKQEIKVIMDELAKYQTHFEKVDNKDVLKNKKYEKEKEELKRKFTENEEKIKFMEKMIKQKDYQLELYKQSLQDKDEVINERDGEIDLLHSKFQELENIVIENYK